MRELLSLTLRSCQSAEHGLSIFETTLWSDYPLGIVRKERDELEAFNFWDILFQKAVY
jgi:hypothetical protein